MSRVLVTGASGFIGQQLVESLLARGHHVACLVRRTSLSANLQRMGVRLITGDVIDPDTLPAAVANAEIVYHLAALGEAHNLADFCRVNEAGTANLINTCARRTTPPVVLLVSSLSAAGPMRDETRLRTEMDPPRPVSNYGQSKLASERVAQSRAKYLPITIVRPPIVLGPGDKRGFALFRNISRWRCFLSAGLGRRVSVVHVSDLVSAMISAAHCGERLPAQSVTTISESTNTQIKSTELGEGIYFVSASEHPQFVELCRMIAQAVGRPRASCIRVPRATLWIAGCCGEAIGRITFRPRYVNLDRIREVTAGHWICSPEKARARLVFVPGASLPERIQQTADWFRQHGWL